MLQISDTVASAGTVRLVTDTSTLDSATERIIDAALQQFEEVGIRRTTIEDIARRAGVERVTVYRRVGSKDDVVAAVVGREAQRAFQSLAEAATAGNSFDDRIATVFTTILRHLLNHTLANRLISLEPESALPRLTTDGSGVLAAAVFATVEMLNTAVQDGLLDAADDFDTRAEVIVRIVHSFMMTPRVHADLTTDDQLAAFARKYIAPIAAGR